MDASTIVRVIRENFPITDAELAMDARLVEDLGFDSIMIFELALILEDEFDIEIPEEMLASLVSLTSAAVIVGELTSS